MLTQENRKSKRIEYILVTVIVVLIIVAVILLIIYKKNIDLSTEEINKETTNNFIHENSEINQNNTDTDSLGSTTNNSINDTTNNSTNENEKNVTDSTTKSVTLNQETTTNEVKVTTENILNKQINEFNKASINQGKLIYNSNQAAINKLFEKINNSRALENVSTLIMSDDMNIIASARAYEISSYYSHTRKNGQDVSDLLSYMGLEALANGEIILQYDAIEIDAIFNIIKSSSNHWKNLMSSKYNNLGIGIYKINNSIYWSIVLKN